MPRAETFVIALLIVGCNRPPPEPPRDPAQDDTPENCYIVGLHAGPGSALEAVLQFDSRFSKAPRPFGPARIEVTHDIPDQPPGAEHVPVCTMSGEIAAASYDPAAKATLRGTLDHPCPAPAPGKVVHVRGWFRQTVPRDFMKYDLSCNYTEAVPAALGGGGRDANQQQYDLNRAEAKRAAPAAFATVDGYLASLHRVGKAIDRAPAVVPSTCKAAKGRTPIFTTAALFDAVVELPDPPKLASADARSSLGVGAFAGKMRTAFGAKAAETKALAALIGGVGDYVAVRRATSVDLPNDSYAPGAHSGTFTPGRWTGTLLLVNRKSGTVECGGHFEASVNATKLKSRPINGDRTISSQLMDEFAGAIDQAAQQTLARIAPSVTLAP